MSFQKLAEDLEAERDPRKQITILRELLSLAQQRELPEAEVECCRRLANAYQDLDNIALAHRFRMAARDIIGARPTEIHPEIQAWVEGDCGRTLYETGKSEEARPYFERALEIAERVGAGRAALIMRFNLILCDLNSGAREDAQSRALKLLDEAESIGDSNLVGRIHFTLGNVMLSQGRLNDCQRHSRRAIAYAEQTGDERLKAAANELVGRSMQMAGLVTGREDYAAEASERLDGAQDQMSRQGSPTREADLESERARLFELGGALPQAAQHYQRALEKYESIRRGLGYEEFQLSYFRHLQPIYESVIELNLRMNRADDAFSAGEQLRSRLLLARLGERALPANAGADGNVEALRATLERYETAAIRSVNDRHGGAPSDGDLAATQREFLTMYERARMHGAPMRSAGPSIVDWASAQADLGADEALISYVVTPRTTIAFVSTREARHFQHLPYGLDDLTREIDELDDMMKRLKSRVLDPYVFARWSGRGSPDEPWPGGVGPAAETVTALLQQLYAVLLAPLRPMVANKPHWTIVPYGPLHRLPWAALRGAGAYVTEKHTVRLLPSVSIGHALSNTPQSAGERAVFFADPDPNHPDLALPGSREEVATCAASFASRKEVLVGERASKSAFFAQATDAGTIHLACHHFFDDKIPILSFVKLAGESSGALYAHEIIDLGLKARLVTLSACGSGASGAATGDEQFGMVRSFLAAGAQSVLSTLWPIDDVSPVTFFSTFYDLTKSMDASAALASTQRRFLSHPCFSLPCFWAPYQLTGC